MGRVARWLPDRFRLARARARGEHLIVAGDLDLIAPVVVDEAACGRPAVALVDNAASTRAVRRLGAIPCPAVARAGVDDARGALLLHRDDGRTFAMLADIRDHANAARAPGNPLEVVVWAEDAVERDRLETSIADRADRMLRVRIASLGELAARDAVRRYPLDLFRRHEDPVRRVAVIGGGPILVALVRRLAIGAHFRDGGKLELLLAPGAETVVAGWPDDDDCVLPARRALADDPAALIAARPVAILIDQGDPSASAANALTLAAAWRAFGQPAPPLYVATPAAMMAGEPMARALGDRAQVLTAETLFGEDHDLLARAVHDFYLDGRLGEGDRIGERPSMAEWEDLDNQLRDENRLLADCYALRLRDVGARLTPGGSAPFRLSADEVDALARAEHDRWMASRLLAGWRWSATRDDARRLHPDILPYDALDARAQDLDREQVRLMTRLVETVGLRAQRVLEVAIEPGAIATGASLSSLLTEIDRVFPGNLVRFTVAADDRAALRAIGDRRADPPPLRLVASGPLPPDVDLLSVDEILVAPPGREAAAIRSGAALIVVAGREAGRQMVRLDSVGTIVQAPWLA